MNALSFEIDEAGVTLMADAAFYWPSGELSELTRKIVPVPGLNCAVFASRGVAMAYPFFLEACGEFRFESWKDFVFNKFGLVWDAFERRMAGIHPHQAEITVAGWNAEAGRGEVLWRTQHDLFAMKSGVTHAWRWPGYHGFGTAPGRTGIAAFEAARLQKFPFSPVAASDTGHIIGGWVDQARIGAHGVTIETVHRWPEDRAGHPIRPAALEANAAA